METKPTHEQAQLHLQVYEMRREAKLRQGREWFFKNYIVQNLDDAMRIAGPGSENGALSMMVPQSREKLANKQFLVNLEKAAQRYETWIESRSPGHIAAMRQFMKQMRAQAASAAKA